MRSLLRKAALWSIAATSPMCRYPADNVNKKATLHHAVSQIYRIEVCRRAARALAFDPKVVV